MTDEAAIRFITFFEKKTAEIGEQWMARWIALRNGKRAVKDVFEVYDRSGEAAEGVHHALVVASDLNLPGRDHTAPFVHKYASVGSGDGVEDALTPLVRSFEDSRYPDEVLGRTIRVHGLSQQGALGPEALEGSARFLRDTDSDLDRTEAALRSLTELDDVGSDRTLRFLRDTDDPEVHQGMRDMIEHGANCGFGLPPLSAVP
jgi:hypothetical protein